MIKVSKPDVGEEEIQAVAEVLRSGNYVSGKQVKAFEEEFAKYLDVGYCVACSSGTSALHMALLSLGIGKGDEVIVPSLTFFATVSAVLYVGATPVFSDIELDTCNMDMMDVAKRITKKTKAVIPVHLYGQSCDMGKLNRLQMDNDYSFDVIEDACQAHGAEYIYAKCGSLGKIGCFSFYATKNLTTGEGGMLTTNDEEVAKQCRMLRNHGMSDENTHSILGFNFRMTEMEGAMGRVQLRKLNGSNRRRQEVAKQYDMGITVDWLRKPVVKDYCTCHAYFWYPCFIDEEKLGMLTLELRKKLYERGVETRYRYTEPLYYQPAYLNWLGQGTLKSVLIKSLVEAEYRNRYPNAEKVCGHILGLPIGSHLTTTDVDIVIDVLNGV